MIDYSKMTDEELVDVKNRILDGTITKDEAQALVAEFRRRAQAAFQEADELGEYKKARERKHLFVVGGKA